jgi:hypothetical protein
MTSKLPFGKEAAAQAAEESRGVRSMTLTPDAARLASVAVGDNHRRPVAAVHRVSRKRRRLLPRRRSRDTTSRRSRNCAGTTAELTRQGALALSGRPVGGGRGRGDPGISGGAAGHRRHRLRPTGGASTAMASTVPARSVTVPISTGPHRYHSARCRIMSSRSPVDSAMASR